MPITDLDTPVSIDIFSDVNFKEGQLALIGKALDYNDMKALIDVNIKGKNNKSGTKANMSVKVHFYNDISTIDFIQPTNKWEIKYNIFADEIIKTTLLNFINN